MSSLSGRAVSVGSVSESGSITTTQTTYYSTRRHSSVVFHHRINYFVNFPSRDIMPSLNDRIAYCVYQKDADAAGPSSFNGSKSLLDPAPQ